MGNIVNYNNNKKGNIKRTAKSTKKRLLAVHLHIYYSEQTDELLNKLNNLFDYEYDLYVTLVEDKPLLRKKILSFKPDAVIWTVPNQGYDVGPFIDFLHNIDLDKYEYVMKIHTKRTNKSGYCIFNHHRFSMRVWREMLLDSVLFSRMAVRRNFSLFAQNPQIGMIGNSWSITKEKQTYYNIEDILSEQMAKINLPLPEDRTFVAGTIFIVRSELLRPFLVYGIDDFAPTDACKHDDTLAHVIERMFGLAVTAQGKTIRGIHYKSYITDRMFVNLRRFLYQKKITREGNKLIKICKIPVYHRKEII